MSFVNSLCNSHTFVALAETRTSFERYVMFDQFMPSSHLHFLGHHNHHSGGCSLSVEWSFLNSCSAFACCALDEESRALYFWSDSEFGSLDIFAVYLDPADPLEQIRVLQLIRKNTRSGAHTLILGDFNFVLQDLDRIQDTHVGAHDFVSRIDHSKAADFWLSHFSDFLEFDQPLYTCKYSGGCSKIDRCFTSLGPLALSVVGTACNLLACNSHLSEHAPVSCKFFELGDHSVRIPSWVANHELFKKGLVSHLLDFNIDCSLSLDELVLQFSSNPCCVAKQILECMYSISRDTKHAVKDSSPVCSLHKLLLVSSFFRALIDGNKQRCQDIAKTYAPCSLVNLDDWSCSAPYNNLQAHYREIQQALALERNKEEQQASTEDDKDSNNIIDFDFGSMSGSYNCIYRMKPGGYSSISALCISRPEQDAPPCSELPSNLMGVRPQEGKNSTLLAYSSRPPSPSSDGWWYSPPPLVNVRDDLTPSPHSGPSSGLPHNQTIIPSASMTATNPVLTPSSLSPSSSPPPLCFTTDTERIASVCNQHWSGIFSKKEVDLSEMNSLFCDVKGTFSHSLETLLPDRKIVEQALLRAKDSATGPDGAPYSAWKAIPSVAIALVLALINLIFLSETEIEQSLLLAFMVFLPKKSFGLTPSGLRLYCAENLRPLSLSRIPSSRSFAPH